MVDQEPSVTKMCEVHREGGWCNEPAVCRARVKSEVRNTHWPLNHASMPTVSNSCLAASRDCSLPDQVRVCMGLVRVEKVKACVRCSPTMCCRMSLDVFSTCFGESMYGGTSPWITGNDPF